MGFISEKFITTVNDRTQVVALNTYNKIAENLQWDKFAKIRDISGVNDEHIVVPIEDEVLDLNVSETYLAESTSFSFHIDVTTNFASRQKTILRSQYTDGVEGVSMMNSFGYQMGKLFARTPEDLVIQALRDNAVTLYDNLSLFNSAHLIHPKKSSSFGTFSNDLTGLPIHATGSGAVSPQVALDNLGVAFSKIYSVPTASGKHSRRLVPKYLVVPPEMRTRAIQITDSAFLASSNGSNDVTSIIRNNGLTAVVMPELSLGGGSATTYYLCCEFDNELATFVIGQKEQFEIVYFTPMSDSDANSRQEYTTRVRGRIGIAPCLPFYTYRCGP